MTKPPTLTAEIQRQLTHIDAPVGTDLSRFPDFLLAGPPRTGSTWLFSNLYYHPDILLPKQKETYFFNTLTLENPRASSFDSLQSYLGAFQDPLAVRLAKLYICFLRTRRMYKPTLFGDATASNSTIEQSVINDLLLLNPGLKVIIVLRDPLERAWSHAKKDILERHSRSPEEVDLQAFDRFFRASGQMQYNRYASIIENWTARLQPRHLLAIEFEAIKSQPTSVLETVVKFLDCQQHVLASSPEKASQPVNTTGTTPMPESVQQTLNDRYADIIEEFDQTLKELTENQSTPGCYLV